MATATASGGSTWAGGWTRVWRVLYAIAAMFPGADVAVGAAVPSPDGGALHGGAVQFGASDLVSFTPAGTASSGTVYVRSQGGRQYAVRVAGATGRTRLLRFDAGTGRWIEE